MFRRCRSTKTNTKANIISRRNNSQIVEKEATIGAKAGQQSSNNNVLQWLEHDAAKDAVPLILAFAGPQKCAALAAVSKHWYDLLHQETTWRVMCEELYKWKLGDPEPHSWLNLYKCTPIVPTDYPDIQRAMNQATKQTTSSHIRILLRPGKHILREALTINTPHNNMNCTVTVETLELPKNLFTPQGQRQTPIVATSTGPFRQQTGRTTCASTTPSSLILADADIIPDPSKRRHSLRDFLRCHRLDDVCLDGKEELFTFYYEEMPSSNSATACLHLVTRRKNEPCFLVRGGTLILRDVNIQHSCPGTDIWRGNAAIHIQPEPSDQQQATTNQEEVPNNHPPAVLLERCRLSSSSGRGIVNINGSELTIKYCAVHDCAATGIYIGGAGGSCVVVESSDVVRNGIGNLLEPTSHTGVTAGHSGIYLCKGQANISESNISANVLSGVTVGSETAAFIKLSASDLCANGRLPLELPSRRTLSYRRSEIADDNNMSETERTYRPFGRSGLLTAADVNIEN